MPTNTSTTSDPADETSSAPSVLDFLYHDSRRVGSFLAQFEGDGAPQQFTRTKNASRGKNESVKADGRLNIKVAAGGLEEKVDTSLLSTEGYARVFDPYWANARTLLDYLSEHDMLNRDFLSAKVGQFVLAKGHLNIYDLMMMKSAWSMPAVQKKMFGESDKPFNKMTPAEKAESRQTKENNELALAMMQVLPHSIHSTLLTGEEGSLSLLWSSLREDYLVQPASDIVLTHGTHIPGEWSIVGILTATPEYTIPEFPDGFDGDGVGTMNSLIGAVSKQLAPIVRVALGRPAYAHAVTPLLIYREVA